MPLTLKVSAQTVANSIISNTYFRFYAGLYASLIGSNPHWLKAPKRDDLPRKGLSCLCESNSNTSENESPASAKGNGACLKAHCEQNLSSPISAIWTRSSFIHSEMP